MIKRFNDYDKVKGYSDAVRLPKGGYVLKILGVESCINSRGEYLKISCDIAEGEFKDFFLQDYRNQQAEDKKWHCNYLLNIPKDDGTEQDGWTKRRFKTFTEALEESNSGYHFDWDEQKFKGKLIGGLFNEREYESNNGEIRRATNLAQVCAVERIREGKYKLPNDRLLERSESAAGAPVDDFISISEGLAEELPFA